jgi:hypothetical protein
VSSDGWNGILQKGNFGKIKRGGVFAHDFQYDPRNFYVTWEIRTIHTIGVLKIHDRLFSQLPSIKTCLRINSKWNLLKDKQ